MKSLSFLIALHAVLSSGQQWNRYPIIPKFQYDQLSQVVGNNWGQGGPYYSGQLSDAIYSPAFLPPLTPNSFEKLNGQVIGSNRQIDPAANNNQYLNSKTNNIEQILSLSSKPVNKNYVGNGVVQNNRNQNNLWYNNGPQIKDDLDIKQGVNKLQNVYLVNNSDNGEPQTQEFIPPSQYLVNEDSDNYNALPLVPQLDPNDLYPNNANVWNPDPYSNECYNLVDIINDLRILLRKNNISEEKQNLKALFRIIRKFIINNNLASSPFSVVVQEIGEVLLNAYNDQNNLRESEIVQILQDFKNRELDDFFRELSSDPNANLPDVVSRFARLLYKLKQLLIYKEYSVKNIKLILHRAVQWYVPFVVHFFEKECKLKTQQYIVQNLELALNVKLDQVKINPLYWGLTGGSDGLDIEDTKNLWGLGGLGNSGNAGNLGGLVVAGNLLNTGGLETPGNLGGLGVGSVGSPGNVGGLESASSLESVGSLVGLGNLESQGSRGDLDNSVTQVYPAGLANSGNLGSLGNLGYPGLGGVGNQVNIQ